MSLKSLTDSFGRVVNYLRIWLTDQCNFRCIYCLPPEGLPCLSQKEILSDDAILRFVTIAVRLGIERIRLTGGEPLLRPKLPELILQLKKISDLRDVALTTNGSRLAEMAQILKDAGLDRINVSLDSLDDEKFRDITLSGAFKRVIAGIEVAAKIGFPLKINVVVLKGMNDDEVLKFANLALQNSVEVRFIEFMPLCGTGWRPELVYPLTEVKKLIRTRFSLYREDGRGDHVAENFVVSDGQRHARLGFIATLSEPFCDSCSRIRLTADGNIRPCLFSREEFAVKPLLDAQASDEEIADRIHLAVMNKPRGSDFFQSQSQSNLINLNAYVGRECETPAIRSIGG